MKLLHVLYSGFNAHVNHKSKPYLSALALKFVFCLREVKYTFTASGFVLDLIIALHRRNLSVFSSYIRSNWSYNRSCFHNRVPNSNCFDSRVGSRTAATPKMELFVTMVNNFYLLTIFVKLSILDVAEILDVLDTLLYGKDMLQNLHFRHSLGS